MLMCLSNEQKYRADEAIKLVHTQEVKARLPDFSYEFKNPRKEQKGTHLSGFKLKPQKEFEIVII